MPILNPTSEVLKQVGILPRTEGNSLSEIMSSNSLGLEDVIKSLSELIEDTKDDHLRLKGLDTALKLHKALEDPNASKTPQITIVIQGSPSGAAIPEICIPRTLENQSN